MILEEELDFSNDTNNKNSNNNNDNDKGSLGTIFEFHSKRMTENTNDMIKCSSHEKIE